MQLHLIYAKARNGVIGRNNELPWSLPEDMKHFKNATTGDTVIMGRKTWDSIPERFRPLPDRTNIVITRQEDWKHEGVRTFSSLDDALSACRLLEHVWIIGGAQIYEQALPHAHTAEVTEIDFDFDGDAFAPDLGSGWIEKRVEGPFYSTTGLKFRWVTYLNTDLMKG